MTSDLCEEDVVQISSPQILTTEALVSPALGAGAAGAAGYASRVAASSAAVELGRRLLLAARAGDTPTVLDLMAKGAPFSTDWLGTSPLHLAAANAHTETCAVLLRAGVSRDSRTKVERTPLHIAAHAGHADVVALLLDYGAIVDCRDMLRMTPLHWAAARGHAAAARALLRRGAELRARCKFRHTPRQLALRHGHRDLAAMLERAEAEADAEQMAEETRKSLGVESLTKTPEIKIEKPKIKLQPETMKQPKLEPTIEAGGGAGAGGAGGEAAAAALLRKHGITLLPTDDGSTVLNAIQSGRTVVLSDAGKLMLKESGCSLSVGGASPAQAGAGAGAGAVATAGTKAKGVVLTATPVRTPPQGVKVFSVNNRLLVPTVATTTAAATVPTTPHKIPVKKIIDPHDLQQMKFVQLSSEAAGAAGAAAGVRAARGGGARARGRAPVKIIMNKTNFTKLIANANKGGLISVNNGVEVASMASVTNVTSQSAAPAESAESGEGGACACACAADNRRLRAELAAVRARLARYES